MSSYNEGDSGELDSALGTLSIRDKSLIKRSISRHHNNNINAGYVAVHEEALHKTGLRGRKTYAFWSLVGLLSLLAWANMILTIVIFQVLRLGGGLESLEILPAEGLVKFLGVTDLGKVYKPDGRIEGFLDEPMSIMGESGASLSLQVEDLKGRLMSNIHLSHNGTSGVSGVSAFQVTTPKSNQRVFSTDSPSYVLPRGPRSLYTEAVKSHRITSPLNEKLVVRGNRMMRLRGIEGTRMEGKEIVWSADQVVTLRSSNGSIVLDSKGGGVELNVKSIPIVGGSRTGLPLSTQFKVCVCMPQGTLFRVPVSTDYSSHIACHNIDQSQLNNPCM